MRGRVGSPPSLVLGPNKECEMAVKFVGVDVVLVARNGRFSKSAVEVNGSGRTGRGLPSSGRFDSIGCADFGEDKAKYPGM